MWGVGKVVESVFTVIRVFSVWIVALMLPKLFIWYAQQTATADRKHHEERFKLSTVLSKTTNKEKKQATL